MLLILINYLYENEVSVMIRKRLLEEPEREAEQASVFVCERDYLEDHNTEAKTPVNL